MSKTKPIYTDRDYLEARFSSSDEKQDRIISMLQIATSRAEEAYAHAENSHKRITSHENRFWGWLIGLGGAGTASGVAFGDAIKGAFKGIIGQ